MGLDPGVSAHNLTSTGSGEPFVAKLDSGGPYVWAKQFAANGALMGGNANALAVDGAGNVYTGGTFSGTVNFDPGLGTHTLTGVGDYIATSDACPDTRP